METDEGWTDNTGEIGERWRGGRQGLLSDLNTAEILARDELCQTPAEA